MGLLGLRGPRPASTSQPGAAVVVCSYSCQACRIATYILEERLFSPKGRGHKCPYTVPRKPLTPGAVYSLVMSQLPRKAGARHFSHASSVSSNLAPVRCHPTEPTSSAHGMGKHEGTTSSTSPVQTPSGRRQPAYLRDGGCQQRTWQLGRPRPSALFLP